MHLAVLMNIDKKPCDNIWVGQFFSGMCIIHIQINFSKTCVVCHIFQKIKDLNFLMNSSIHELFLDL